MHARKTGALIRAAAVAGAIMAGAPPARIDAVDRYAAALGLAFQIVDDVLDVEGEGQALGKTAGKDAAAGKPTYPSLFGLDASKRMAQEAADAAVAALADARAASAAGSPRSPSGWSPARRSPAEPWPPSPRSRLDVRLVDEGLAVSRERARALILAGRVHGGRRRRQQGRGERPRRRAASRWSSPTSRGWAAAA